MSATRRILPTITVAALAALTHAQSQPRVAAPPVAAPDIKTPYIDDVPVTSNEAPSRGVPANVANAPTASARAANAQLTPTSAVKGLDFSAVRFQEGSDGSLWARGRTYKARFDEQSATVIPYFSARAPRNFDVSFELESVSAGGRTLELDSRASVSHDEAQVTLDRGPVDEQYVLGLERLEQRFVLERLPAAGELRLRMSVATELEGASSERGFSFSNEWGRLEYGRATAIDAAGRTLALESTLIDGRIEIVVPASFAASAALPLTIDPVLSIFGVDTNMTTAFSGDSSYDLSGGGVLHVYNVLYSANDYDVGSYATDRFGNVWAGTFLWTDFTSAHWVQPRVAHHGATDRFLIAAQVGQPGARAVWGHVRTIYNNPGLAPAQLTPTDSFDKFNVDVGGDPYPTPPSYFCVVYQRLWSVSDTDIHAQLVDANGTPSGGALLVDNSFGTLDSAPTISKSNGAADWNFAWQRDASGQPSRVRGARVLWNGAISTPSFPISSGSQPERRPSVSSSITNTSNFMVACERDFVSDNDIMLYALTNGAVATSYNLSGADGGTLFRNQREPSIDSDGSHFTIGFAEQWPNAPFDDDVYASEAQWNNFGVSIRQHRMPLATTGSHEGQVQIVAAESSNPAQGLADYTAIYNRGIEPVTAGPTDDVFAALVVGTYGGLIANFCSKADVSCPCVGSGVGGCANSTFASGAHMAASGNSRTQSGSLQFQVSGLKPNATALIFQGTGTLNLGFGFPLGDGVRCVGGTTTRFVPAPASLGGTLTYPLVGQPSIASQGFVPLMGGFYYYQTWYRDTANFCTSDATNLSDALMVEWTP